MKPIQNARIFIPAFGLFAALSLTSAFAQSNTWTKTALSQYIRTIVIDKNNHIYAAGNGLHLSTDAGVTWSKIENGLPASLVSFGISPRGDFFACGTFEVYRSMDQGNSWKLCFSGSPNSISGIAFTPASEIYVTAGNGGIHHSKDNGNTWSQIPIGLSTRAHTAIDINFGIICVADTNYGIWEFFEGGDRWYIVNGWMPYKSMLALLVTPTRQILAGTTKYGIYSLPLNSFRIYPANNGLQSMGITDLALASNGDIFACSNQSGVYRSTDDGKNWTQINRGLPVGRIASVAIDNNYRLYAGTTNDGLYRRLQLNTVAPAASTLLSPLNNALVRTTSIRLQWRSVNGADSYRVQVASDTTSNSFIVNQGGITNPYYDLPALAFNQTYYWRVEALNPEGVNWSTWWKFSLTNATTTNPLPIWPPDGATNVSPTPKFRWNIVAAATSYSLVIATGPALLAPEAWVIDPCCITDTLYQAVGLYSNTTYYWWVTAHFADNSTKLLSLPWKFTAGSAEPSAAWKKQSSGTRQTLRSNHFVDAQRGWTVGDSGLILHTENGGATWKRQNSKTTEQLKSVDFVDARNGFAVGNNGIILSTNDGGNTWINQNLNGVPLLESVVAIAADTVIVSGGSQLFQTFDGGKTWIKRDIDDNATTALSISSIHFTDSQYGWAATTSFAACRGCIFFRIFHTFDGGKNWVRKSSDWGSGFIFFVDTEHGWLAIPARRNARFFNPGRGVISSTTDAGANWQSQFIRPGILFRSIDFVSSQIGIAVGDAGVIFHTLDGGKHWNFQISGTTMNFEDVDFIDGQNGWIVGADGLILHTTNGGVTAIDESSENRPPQEFLLRQNYPNPFNPITSIEFSVPRMSYVTIKIYNLRGEEIETLTAREYSPGIFKVQWKPKGLASGVYFYRLRAGNLVLTKKMALVR